MRKLVELERRNVFSEGKRVADRLAMADLTLHDEHVVLKGSKVKPNDRSDLVGAFVRKHQAKRREATLRAQANFGKFYNLVGERAGV